MAETTKCPECGRDFLAAKRPKWPLVVAGLIGLIPSIFSVFGPLGNHASGIFRMPLGLLGGALVCSSPFVIVIVSFYIAIALTQYYPKRMVPTALVLVVAFIVANAILGFAMFATLVALGLIDMPSG